MTPDGETGTEVPALVGHRVVRPRQQVEDALRAAVLNGRLRTGERLPAEAELARQFNVSRPTVREALTALQSQGLIRKLPGAGGGSFVQAVDHHALGEIVQTSVHNLLQLGSVSFDEVSMVRQHLEVPAAVLAAARRTDDDVAELRRILKEQRIRSVDDPDVPGLDAEFHIAIAQISGNRVLAALVYAVHRESEPVSYLELSAEVGRETYLQHEAIVDAIAAGDAAAAEAAITAHLSYLRAHIKAANVGPAAPRD
ncbi:FadR family transcriptional regulator [Nocardioides marmoriginsengisoli]|uniref:FadR family transcriptional regulator n=1 Tax=Nocardioides marmoriginsengisoli TaxID=661483 RepID=A0A3N0CH91_9ACTN|nr:FCD domain-containing protein [Nocardioides marmoriginsengisoli]RNL62817.1 FadR family transcriptional regulator [Nocardioides marmoriginsengisoli]